MLEMFLKIVLFISEMYRRINGRRVRVEMSSGKSRWGSRGPPTRRGGGGRGNREERRRSR